MGFHKRKKFNYFIDKLLNICKFVSSHFTHFSKLINIENLPFKN